MSSNSSLGFSYIGAYDDENDMQGGWYDHDPNLMVKSEKKKVVEQIPETIEKDERISIEQFKYYTFTPGTMSLNKCKKYDELNKKLYKKLLKKYKNVNDGKISISEPESNVDNYYEWLKTQEIDQGVYIKPVENLESKEGDKPSAPENKDKIYPRLTMRAPGDNDDVDKKDIDYDRFSRWNADDGGFEKFFNIKANDPDLVARNHKNIALNKQLNN